MRKKVELREELFGKPSRAEKIRQRQRGCSVYWDQGMDRLHDGALPTFSDLPSSCIVLPMHTDMTVSHVSFHTPPCHWDSKDFFSLNHAMSLTRNNSMTSFPGKPESHIMQQARGDLGIPDVDRLADWVYLMCGTGHKERVLELIDR